MGLLDVSTILALRHSPHYTKVLSLFVVTSFVAIFATTSLLSGYLANYMTRHMMQRDAEVTMEFLNSIIRAEDASDDFFGDTADIRAPATAEFFARVARLPHVFRANVYSRSGRVLWSSDAEMIGRTFADNAELAATLKGELHPEIVAVEPVGKDEHVGLPDTVEEFITFHIPIWSRDGRIVVGAVEVYKAPQSLLDAIRGIERLAWIDALIAGAVLFALLVAVVAYSTRILRRQEARLVEAERLAVVGEMASAVAHGLRNPLAAIRSCAELLAEDDLPDSSRRGMLDIMNQVDRLETWIRSFLKRTREAPASASDIAHVDLVLQRCIQGFQTQLRKRGIRVEISGSTDTPVVAARSEELEQILNTILSNAVEAMKTGGVLSLGWHAVPGGRVAIDIADTGPGVSDEQMKRLFVPFQTGKAAGLGVGLALGRRIAERIGGTLDLKNRPDRGVEVTLTVPARA